MTTALLSAPALITAPASNFAPISVQCGDSVQLMRTLRSSTVHFLCSDLPYGAGQGLWDIKAPAEVWVDAFRVLRPGGFAVLACGNPLIGETIRDLEAAGFHYKSQVIWAFGNAAPLTTLVDDQWRSALQPGFEPWLVFQKPREKGHTLKQSWAVWGTGAVKVGRVGEPGWQTNVFYCEKPKGAERNLGTIPGKAYGLPPALSQGALKHSTTNINQHPTVKPLALMRALCQTFCKPGGLILDPFLGSGTTLMAAAADGYAGVGFELDPGYAALARDRIRFAQQNPHLIPAAVKSGLR